MARSRRNPRGLPVPEGIIVLVGKNGQNTHLLNPSTKQVLCKSGRAAGRYPSGASAAERKQILAARRAEKQEVYTSRAKEVTCYRCAKLAAINIEAGRDAWDAG